MKVLVINAGSSSLKYQLINMENEQVMAKGVCEKIGIEGNIIHKTADGKVDKHDAPFPTHAQAFQELIRVLTSGENAVLKDVSEISAIGHRVVQGTEKYARSVLIDDDVLSTVIEASDLAPLHNPPGVVAIKACQEIFSDSVPQVAVFDTAFHQTMPEKAYMFPIPYEYYEKYHIRRYGYHGTSHRYVSARYAKITGKDLNGLKIITCHLGNGSSIAAVKDGKSIDTSMGFTPLDGIIMGTRSGAIDPSVATYIGEKENLTAHEMGDILNKKSGILGISGVSSDQRDVTAAARAGNRRAALALEIQQYQIKKYIGSYAAAMGGLDVLIFTGGIGENDAAVREGVCADMGFLGIKIDPEVNKQFTGQEKNISTPDAKVEVWIIPTNEELLIARDTAAIVGKK